MAKGKLGGYWINEKGTVLHCDGHKGRFSHSSYVSFIAWHRILKQLASASAMVAVELRNIIRHTPHDDGAMLRCYINNAIDGWVSREYITYEDSYNIYEFIRDELSINRDEFDILLGQYPGCPRQYAIRNWGWIRVVEHHIEIPSLTDDVCKRLYAFALSQENTKWHVEIYNHNGSAMYIQDMPTPSLHSQATILAFHRG